MSFDTEIFDLLGCPVLIQNRLSLIYGKFLNCRVKIAIFVSAFCILGFRKKLNSSELIVDL